MNQIYASYNEGHTIKEIVVASIIKMWINGTKFMMEKGIRMMSLNVIEI